MTEYRTARKTFASWAACLFLAATAGGQSTSGFWQGTYTSYQYNFSFGVGHDYSVGRNFTSRSVEVWQTDYKLYLNPAGIVREELTRMNRNRSVEGPLDIRLLDYDRNQAIVFDRGGQEEIRGPLTPAGRNIDLGEKRILGILCDGKEYRWETFQKSEVQLQRWLPRESSIRVPLLEVEYYTEPTGALLSMRVQMVSKLEPASDLPASLFEPPAGLKITEVPNIE